MLNVKSKILDQEASHQLQQHYYPTHILLLLELENSAFCHAQEQKRVDCDGGVLKRVCSFIFLKSDKMFQLLSTSELRFPGVGANLMD